MSPDQFTFCKREDCDIIGEDGNAIRSEHFATHLLTTHGIAAIIDGAPIYSHREPIAPLRRVGTRAPLRVAS